MFFNHKQINFFMLRILAIQNGLFLSTSPKDRYNMLEAVMHDVGAL